MDKKEIKNYVNSLLKSDYDLICSQLMPRDRILFTEKYINGKTNKELKVTSFRINNLNDKLERIIRNIKHKSIENISESLLRYRCKEMHKSKEYTDFVVDAFCNNLTNKELADKYILDIRTIAIYKCNRKKELENF